MAPGCQIGTSDSSNNRFALTVPGRTPPDVRLVAGDGRTLLQATRAELGNRLRTVDRLRGDDGDASLVVPPPAWRHDAAIVFTGEGEVPATLQRYAAWSGRPILRDGRGPLGLRHATELGAVLLVGPDFDPSWERLLASTADAPLDGPAQCLLPYGDEPELRRLLVLTAARVSLLDHAVVEHRTVTDVASFPNVIAPVDYVDAIMHSRPYCGAIRQGGSVAALCTSPRGRDGVCIHGSPCPLGRPATFPAEDAAAPIVFLDGCSTAFPPIDRLPFDAAHLVGLRLFRATGGLVLGNLGLGHAATWELTYRRVLAEHGRDLVEQVRSINAARERVGHEPLFRLVALGDLALVPPTVLRDGATAQFDGSMLRTSAVQRRGVPAVRLDRSTLGPTADAAELEAEVRTRSGHALDAPLVYVRDRVGDGGLLFVDAAALGTGGDTMDHLVVRRRRAADTTDRALDQLTSAARGLLVAACLGPEWKLWQTFDTVQNAVHAGRELAARSRLAPFRFGEADALVGSATRLAAAAGECILTRYLGLLDDGRLELRSLYGSGVVADAEESGPRTCPVCRTPAWLVVRRPVVAPGTGVGQLQCPLCAIVLDGPMGLEVGQVRWRGTDDVRLSVPLTNLWPHPVALSFTWRPDPSARTEASMRGSQTRLLASGATAICDFTADAVFLPKLLLHLCAGGYIGFVQIKDVEAARFRPATSPPYLDRAARS